MSNHSFSFVFNYRVGWFDRRDDEWRDRRNEIKLLPTNFCSETATLWLFRNDHVRAEKNMIREYSVNAIYST